MLSYVSLLESHFWFIRRELSTELKLSNLVRSLPSNSSTRLEVNQEFLEIHWVL